MKMVDFNNAGDKLSGTNGRGNLSEQENLSPSRRGKIDKITSNEFSETELKKKILDVTKIIKEKFPELSKFLNETPESEVDYEHPEICLQDLRDYYQSLSAILVKYELEHPID